MTWLGYNKKAISKWNTKGRINDSTIDTRFMRICGRETLFVICTPFGFMDFEYSLIQAKWWTKTCFTWKLFTSDLWRNNLGLLFSTAMFVLLHHFVFFCVALSVSGKLHLLSKPYICSAVFPLSCTKIMPRTKFYIPTTNNKWIKSLLSCSFFFFNFVMSFSSMIKKPKLFKTKVGGLAYLD